MEQFPSLTHLALLFANDMQKNKDESYSTWSFFVSWKRLLSISSTVKLRFKKLLNKEQLGNSEPFPVTNMPVHQINSEQIVFIVCYDQKVPYYQVWLCNCNFFVFFYFCDSYTYIPKSSNKPQRLQNPDNTLLSKWIVKVLK